MKFRSIVICLLCLLLTAGSVAAVEVETIEVSKEVSAVVNLAPIAENLELTTYRETAVGDYTVMPLIASHSVPLDSEHTAMHHIVTTPEGKTLFYGLDGAWFFGPSWLVMKEYRFDAMVLDCTVGDSDDWRLFEHNTIPMLRTMTKGIREAGLVKDGGQLIASHMARTLHGSHEETAAILAGFGMAAAYDGMKIDF